MAILEAGDIGRYLLDPAIMMAAQVFLGCIFLAAAVGKMRAWAQFQGVVQNYRILPPPLAAAFAYLLPPFELATGAGLLIPTALPVAGSAAAALLLVFSAAIAINVARGRTDIDCGCFQAAFRQHLSWWLVLRNVVMAALAVAAALAATGSATGRAIGALDIAAAMVSGLALFALYTAANTLSALAELPMPNARPAGPAEETQA